MRGADIIAEYLVKEKLVKKDHSQATFTLLCMSSRINYLSGMVMIFLWMFLFHLSRLQ